MGYRVSFIFFEFALVFSMVFDGGAVGCHSFCSFLSGSGLGASWFANLQVVSSMHFHVFLLYLAWVQQTSFVLVARCLFPLAFPPPRVPTASTSSSFDTSWTFPAAICLLLAEAMSSSAFAKYSVGFVTSSGVPTRPFLTD